jgi:transcriptional regulator with XRE-family HTH domain
MSTEASQVRVWMRAVMEKKDWSAEEWARKAETSPTNITRFLRGSKHMPSTRTIAKLARVAGSAPAIGRPVVDLATALVPVYARPLSQKGAAEVRAIGRVRSMEQVSERAFGVKVQHNSFAAQGIAAGDVIVFEPADIMTPKQGSLICWLSPEAQDGYEFGRVIGKEVMLLSGSAFLSQPLDRITPAGVGVELHRSLALPGNAPETPRTNGRDRG